MGDNSFGTLFSFTSFGESHGPAIGCVVDGVRVNAGVIVCVGVRLYACLFGWFVCGCLCEFVCVVLCVCVRAFV